MPSNWKSRVECGYRMTPSAKVSTSMSEDQPTRSDVVSIVIRAVKTILQRRGLQSEITEQTVLSGGPAAVLDSLGMVMLTVEIEQQIEERFNGSYRLSPEGLMAAASSDVETIGTLSDLVLATLESQ